MHEISDCPEWFEALTLSERAALLGSEDEIQPPPAAGDRAPRRAQRWRDESDLLDDTVFAERLAHDGLTPDRFLRILAEPASEWQRRTGAPPAWLEPLARAFSRPATPLLDGVAGSLGILELLRPLIDDGLARLSEGLRRISAESSRFAPGQIAAQLLETLLRRLRWATERTLVLELHVSRLEGKLQGETPEERFGSFISSLREPGTSLEILRRYPVLARDACRHVEQWVTTNLEMMERFAADRGEICARFADGEDGSRIVAVQCGLSDRHDGGRSVAILTFESGLRVVYKPKSLAIDVRFQELIAWLNQRGAAPPLRCAAVLDHGSYGWMEHVAPAPCETPEEVERFYERQGAWAALFYGLEATDFHHENLIASGEHPVPIDLETLLQPSSADPALRSLIIAFRARTVLRSGLLPRRFGSQADLDLSGMGAVGGQALEVKQITDEGTDRMRWASAWNEMQAEHLPTLQGRPVEIWKHREAVLRGFRSMYRLLELHREELLGGESPLTRMAQLSIRILLRPTNVYAYLFHAGNHPDFQQSGLDRDRLFDRLWLDAVHSPLLRRAVHAERAAMAEGDVPLFTTQPNSTDLLHSGGRIEGYLSASGLELVRSRLQSLGEEDLERQYWLVRASLETTRSTSERQWSEVWLSSPLPQAAPAAPERFIKAACRIGDRLARLEIEQGDLAFWFHLHSEGEGWRLQPVPVGLYSGLSGIALFLAHLGSLAGGERHERLARCTAETIRKRLVEDKTPLGLGAFSGSGSALYALTHLGILWEEPGLLDAAEELVSRIAPSIESDTVFDLIGGSAGSAATLLALHRHRSLPAVLETAVRCGDHLLAKAVHSDRGTAWPPFREADPLPLTGFGHGTAGIAWALARLAQVTGEHRFEEAARGATAYERSWFCPEREGWPDLRGDRGTDGQRTFMYAWCHGAPGIGLGRIGSLSCLNDAEMLSEIRIAARSTLAQGFGFNHSLCHGDLGNLELVREAGRVLGDQELAAEADRLAARILVQIEQEGPRWGARTETEVPGLMTGLAGIGYGLLRAAYPNRVPSVLLLETPGAG